MIRVDDVIWSEIRCLFSFGLSKREIAKRMKCSRCAVYGALRSAIPPSERNKTKRSGPTKKPHIARRRATVRQLLTAKHTVIGEKIMKQRGRPRKDGTPRPTYVVRRTRVKLSYPSPSAVGRILRADGMAVSDSTVRRDAAAIGLVAYVRPRRSTLFEGDPARRVSFCKWIIRQPKVFCATVLLSDEKIFDANDHGHRYQYLLPQHKGQIVPREQSSCAASVMVWAVIGINFRFLVFLKVPEGSSGINSAEYISQCLKPLTTGRKRFLKTKTLMQDGAKIHWTQDAQTFCESNGLKLLHNWPAHSADLNPLENLWNLLQTRVSERGPFGEDQLKRFIREEFDRVDQSTINSLVESFRGRCAQCVQRRGSHILQENQK